MLISIFVIIINSKLKKSERHSMVINAKYHRPDFGVYWHYKKQENMNVAIMQISENPLLFLETKSNFS